MAEPQLRTTAHSVWGLAAAGSSHAAGNCTQLAIDEHGCMYVRHQSSSQTRCNHNLCVTHSGAMCVIVPRLAVERCVVSFSRTADSPKSLIFATWPYAPWMLCCNNTFPAFRSPCSTQQHTPDHHGSASCTLSMQHVVDTLTHI